MTVEILNITFHDFLTPEFYINHGGLWLTLFIVFAETGLMVGFFLPGDSLLFVAGIYSKALVNSVISGGSGSEFLDLAILFVLISISGIAGNSIGYWFGARSGPYLFKRKDNFFFRKKHLYQAKEFFNRHGGPAIVLARFLPIIRTFVPIISGIILFDKKKFLYYNVIGSTAWCFTILMAGHFLEKLFLNKLGIDLKKHLEIIIVFLVIVTTAPVLYKLIFKEKVTQKSDMK